jgi:glycosyltransferase involved in cell wall biosynthesis
MISDPKISIVTPSYNQGTFLEATIKSILSQRYGNLEFILIDGGSTDNSMEIVEKYRDSITYWVSEKDQGQSDAINKGLLRVTGDIIAYINSDDTYLPNTFKTVAKVFQLNPTCKWICGNVLFMDERGSIFAKKKPIYSQLILRYGSSSIYQPSVFLKREILKEVGYLNNSFHCVMDQEWFCRIAEKYPPLIVDTDFSCFRWHRDSKSSSSKNSAYYKRLFQEKKDIALKYNKWLNFLLNYYPARTLKLIQYIIRFIKLVKRVSIKRYKIG